MPRPDFPSSAMGDASPALRVQGVEKSYGSLRALKGVSFEIERGEFFGLLGPNGAGKSTLINVASGLVRATAGDVAVLGHDVQRDFRRARQSLGVVPQEIVYDPFFTVRDMLRIQAGYYGCGREVWDWADYLLERLELSDKRDATMRQLSGGMKRRVLIAQALVHKPPVVILDEPTAGVDVELRRTLWSFARELHAAGHTIVLTTHYLEEAEALCERLAIMNKGELLALEKTRDFLGRHPFRFLKLTVEGDAAVPDAIEALVADRSGNELELQLTRGQDSVAGVLDGLRNAGLQVTDVHTREPSLEDIFVELTGEAA